MSLRKILLELGIRKLNKQLFLHEFILRKRHNASFHKFEITIVIN